MLVVDLDDVVFKASAWWFSLAGVCLPYTTIFVRSLQKQSRSRCLAPRTGIPNRSLPATTLPKSSGTFGIAGLDMNFGIGVSYVLASVAERPLGEWFSDIPQTERQMQQDLGRKAGASNTNGRRRWSCPKQPWSLAAPTDARRARRWSFEDVGGFGPGGS